MSSAPSKGDFQDELYPDQIGQKSAKQMFYACCDAELYNGVSNCHSEELQILPQTFKQVMNNLVLNVKNPELKSEAIVIDSQDKLDFYIAEQNFPCKCSASQSTNEVAE
jgi:transcriptional antiterminator